MHIVGIVAPRLYTTTCYNQHKPSSALLKTQKGNNHVCKRPEQPNSMATEAKESSRDQSSKQRPEGCATCQSSTNLWQAKHHLCWNDQAIWPRQVLQSQD